MHCQQNINRHKGGQVSPRSMHCTLCGMLKGTCLAEAASNCDKIKLIALAIIVLHMFEVHLSEGISQSGKQSVSQSVSQSVIQSVSESVDQSVSDLVSQSVSQSDSQSVSE